MENSLEVSWIALCENNDGTCCTITPQNMKHHDQTESMQVWKGHDELGDDLTITIQTTTEGPLTVGTITVSGDQGHITQLHYPVITLPFTPETEFLWAGSDLGVIVRHQAIPREGDNGIPMKGVPLWALLGKDSCFYCDIRRRDHRPVKATYRLSPDQSQITLAMIHFPTPSAPSHVSAFGTLRGGWFQCAETYRNWRWGGKGETSQRQPMPKLRDIDLWFWNRGLIKDVLPPILQLKEERPDLNLALNWYWWHHNPYDTDYPDFWPPREGIDAFRDAVRTLHQHNVFTHVYINGVCWDMDGKTWTQGGQQDVIIKPDGSPVNVPFNQYNHHRLAFMCGEAPHFHDRISTLVKHLHDCGLDGQYLDMICNMGAYSCYNPLHRHAPGTPHVFIEGYRKLLQRLKDENPDFELSSEGCSEYYMDLLDSANICNTISREHLLGNPNILPIPLFTAVYHGRAAYYGNYASPDGIPPWDPKWPPEDRWQHEQPWHRLFPDQFYFEAMRNIVFGAQPTVCDYRITTRTDPELADANDLIKQLATFYHEHKSFLFDGQMTDPTGFQCNRHNVRFHQRFIFTKPGLDKTLSQVFPAILHSCWKDAQGQEKLFLANYTTEPQPWAFKKHSGTIPPRTLQAIAL